MSEMVYVSLRTDKPGTVNSFTVMMKRTAALPQLLSSCLIGIVEIIVFVQQPACERCRTFSFPYETARVGISLGCQFHVGIDCLSALHHV